MKIFQFFQETAEKIRKGEQELLFADWTDDGGAFLLVYRDENGQKCVLSFRREEIHG